MKDLAKKVQRKFLPDWLKCLRSVWALAIVLAFVAGYLMGMYQDPDDESKDMLADVREEPLQYHDAVSGDDYGFHRRHH
jgi:hypothetical protein